MDARFENDIAAAIPPEPHASDRGTTLALFPVVRSSNMRSHQSESNHLKSKFPSQPPQRAALPCRVTMHPKEDAPKEMDPNNLPCTD